VPIMIRAIISLKKAVIFNTKWTVFSSVDEFYIYIRIYFLVVFLELIYEFVCQSVI